MVMFGNTIGNVEAVQDGQFGMVAQAGKVW